MSNTDELIAVALRYSTHFVGLQASFLEDNPMVFIVTFGEKDRPAFLRALYGA